VGAKPVVVTLAAAALAGCGGGDKPSATPAGNTAPASIGLSSPDFQAGGAIPRKFTCDGAGTAPALVWKDAPQDATELVLVVQDPDAPSGTFVHWTAYGIPIAGRGIVPQGAKLPAGAGQGENSAGKTGWTPPCPPKGNEPHHYVFSLYALPKASGLAPGAKAEDVRAALKAAVARGSVIGTYGR
jgi:Raf kinase inhibitor-like YbhB/YbcL family protein